MMPRPEPKTAGLKLEIWTCAHCAGEVLSSVVVAVFMSRLAVTQVDSYKCCGVNFRFFL